MTPIQAAPLLIILITGLLLGLLAWSLILSRNRSQDYPNLIETPGNLRLWLLLLGVFSLGAFIAYTLEIFIVKR